MIVPSIISIIGIFALAAGFAGQITRWDWPLRAFGLALLIIAGKEILP